MAQEDDDADKLPPLGDDTAKYLEDAKKGKLRSFLLGLQWSQNPLFGSRSKLVHCETKPTHAKTLS
jgi:hypothetical protein